ncbi:hypothetical protein [Polaromonas sp. P5_D5]
MDQDFMKSGDRERPFSPTPEQPLLRWIGFLLVLLALIYAGYRVWESQSDRVSPVKTKQAAPATNQPSPQPQTSAQPQPIAPATPAPGTRIVTKCVINGKTIYSDNACPQGAAGAQVVTKADHNLMTGLSPTQMAAADRIPPAAPSLSTIAPSVNATPDKRSECVFIDAEIKRLDALARQPLSAQTQDEITRARKELRDRQFRIHC